MKALSIRQPWAWLIAHGHKDIENRDWQYKPSYRGNLLIHASKTFDYEGHEFVEQNFPDIELPSSAVSRLPSAYNSVGFVGLAELADVVTESDSPWFFGPQGFVLESPTPIEFIEWRGQLGLFNVPDKVISQITPQTNRQLNFDT